MATYMHIPDFKALAYILSDILNISVFPSMIDCVPVINALLLRSCVIITEPEASRNIC